MLTLVFDTETTGKADFKAQSLVNQPYMVQLGAILLDDWRVVAEINMITEPVFRGDRAPVPIEASNIHGINDEMIDRAGFSYKVAMPMFNQLLRRADRLVAHNMQYDFLIARATYSRIAADQDILLGIPKICTMKSAETVLKLPGKYGYKWPTLDEAFRGLVDPDGFEGAHDAMVDVRACVQILKALEDAGHPLTH